MTDQRLENAIQELYLAKESAIRFNWPSSIIEHIDRVMRYAIKVRNDVLKVKQDDRRRGNTEAEASDSESGGRSQASAS